LTTLGTDGFGRSDTLPALRRFSKSTLEMTVVATLYALATEGEIRMDEVEKAIRELNIDPEEAVSRCLSDARRTFEEKEIIMDVRLPRLGEGADSGVIATVFVKEGDQIQKDQPVLEIESEKGGRDIPAPAGGRVAKVW